MIFLSLFVMEVYVYKGEPLVFIIFLSIYNSASPMGKIWDLIYGMDIHKPKTEAAEYESFCCKIKKYRANLKVKEWSHLLKKDLLQAFNRKLAVSQN